LTALQRLRGRAGVEEGVVAEEEDEEEEVEARAGVATAEADDGDAEVLSRRDGGDEQGVAVVVVSAALGDGDAKGSPPREPRRSERGRGERRGGLGGGDMASAAVALAWRRASTPVAAPAVVVLASNQVIPAAASRCSCCVARACILRRSCRPAGT
jgi:hypothetical protein